MHIFFWPRISVYPWLFLYDFEALTGFWGCTSSSASQRIFRRSTVSRLRFEFAQDSYALHIYCYFWQINVKWNVDVWQLLEATAKIYIRTSMSIVCKRQPSGQQWLKWLAQAGKGLYFSLFEVSRWFAKRPWKTRIGFPKLHLVDSLWPKKRTSCWSGTLPISSSVTVRKDKDREAEDGNIFFQLKCSTVTDTQIADTNLSRRGIVYTRLIFFQPTAM